MPARAYVRTHPEARQQLLDRVAAGELTSHVCAEPGMPSYASVYAWARADPFFAEALADARRRGDFRRWHALDEAKAGALLARLAAGEGIVSILRDPTMPSRRQYAYWRATQAPFQEAVWRLNQVTVVERARRGRARWRPFDQALADQIVVRVSRGEGLQAILNAGQGLPCRNVVIRWRKAQPQFAQALRIAVRVARRRRDQARAVCPDHLVEAICDGVAEGGTLNTVSRLSGMPCAATLYAWMRTRPDFAQAVEQARARRMSSADVNAALARMAARAAAMG
ncbi:hypothetical protein [Phenylobacterium sp.]|uniref:terminase small subunit-like protein n=1 Tax=Phenylobacterium sp. TaxID=1871053 RepID=UPI00273464E1|nr:hypothetical protein [Phenylobacterium sp.]MDP3852545.1 hypothetical protein [Phenylobacterium sp.]